MMDDKYSLSERLSSEADLCRNDGADDIAKLLDEAACAIRSFSKALAAHTLAPSSSTPEVVEALRKLSHWYPPTSWTFSYQAEGYATGWRAAVTAFQNEARAAIAALPPSNSLEDGSERTSNMSLPAYARWASRALNRLSGGGSEMFMRLSDGEYYADPDLAVERANHRTDAMRKLGIPSNMIGEVSSECAACKARERDAWAPDPDDPFWMLEVRQGFDNAGAWAKNLETCLTTREPIKALRFPSRFAAEVARRRLYPLDDQFEPTEHSWIVMPPRSTAISEAIDCPLCKQIGEVLAKSIGGAVHYAVEPELSTVDYSFALRDEAGELHRLLCDIHPLDEDGCFKNGSEARALASRGEKL